MADTPYKLEAMIGERILAFVPMLSPSPERPSQISVILRGVEAGGVWLEVDRSVLSALRKSDGNLAIVVFVAWPNVVWLAPLPALGTGATH